MGRQRRASGLGENLNQWAEWCWAIATAGSAEPPGSARISTQSEVQDEICSRQQRRASGLGENLNASARTASSWARS